MRPISPITLQTKPYSHLHVFMLKTMLLNSCLRDLLWSSILCPYLEKGWILSVPNYMVQVINTLLEQQLHNQSILLYFFDSKTQHH